MRRVNEGNRASTIRFAAICNLVKLALTATGAAAVVLFLGSWSVDSQAASVSAASAPVAHTQLVSYREDPGTVWLYDQNGDPELAPTCSYTAGHVYDEDDNLIGNVPNPTTDGHIYDPNSGDSIGLIDPSPAATAELPPGG